MTYISNTPDFKHKKDRHKPIVKNASVLKYTNAFYYFLYYLKYSFKYTFTYSTFVSSDNIECSMVDL